jgi:prephenate dehydrogenase
MRSDLDRLIEALDGLSVLEGPDGPVAGGAPVPRGARAAVAQTIADGNSGRDRIPGKHGGRAAVYQVLGVLVPDQPGSLARLFADIGEAHINVEELSLEHAPGREVGLIEVSVVPVARATLERFLTARGWQVVS